MKTNNVLKTTTPITKIKRLLDVEKFLVVVIQLGFIMLITATLVMGQPPGFPTQPDQTPIDGGLLGVALASGAYAIKRLRSVKRK